MNFDGLCSYNLIVNITDENVEYVRVDAIATSLIRRLSYDDPNAVYERDKDNVYLNDCPPPFSVLSIKDKDDKVVNNAYAVADMSNVKSMSKFAFERFCEIVDNGARISDKDMQTVKHHPWPQQMQKEKNLSNTDRLAMVEGLLPYNMPDNSDEIER